MIRPWNYIEKSENKYVFDSRFKSDQISIFEKVLSRSIEGLSFQHLEVVLSPDCYFISSNKYIITFQTDDGNLHIALESFCDEFNYLVGTQRAISVQMLETRKVKLSERLLYPPLNLDSAYASTIRYPIEAPLAGIDAYGYYGEYHTEKDKKVSDLLKAHLAIEGFDILPSISAYSIACLVFKHQDGRISICTNHLTGFNIYIAVEISMEEFIERQFLGNLQLLQSIK